MSRAKSAAYLTPRRFWHLVASSSRPGKASGLLTGWWLWEQIAKQVWPSQAIPEAPAGLLRVRLIHYRGPALTLPDDTAIKPGAIIGELHCENLRFLRALLVGELVATALRGDLAALARWTMREGICFEALYGFTLLGAGAARLGFYRRQVPLTWRRRANRLFMNGLIALYHPDGIRRLERGRTLSAPPVEIWLSRTQLLRRYRDHEA
ncbi:MAG TPA: hypothetical protein VKV28_09900 [Candidatus Binataceae bacterium]|nr:hypothetical protein [Candidatus Binataceae bacterium]